MPEKGEVTQLDAHYDEKLYEADFVIKIKTCLTNAQFMGVFRALTGEYALDDVPVAENMRFTWKVGKRTYSVEIPSKRWTYEKREDIPGEFQQVLNKIHYVPIKEEQKQIGGGT